MDNYKESKTPISLLILVENTYSSSEDDDSFESKKFPFPECLVLPHSSLLLSTGMGRTLLGPPFLTSQMVAAAPAAAATAAAELLLS